MSYCQSQTEDVVVFVELQDWNFVIEPSIEWNGMLVNDEKLRSLTLPSQTVELLNFDKLVGQFRCTVQQFPDQRTGDNSTYRMEDAALSALSVFFMQSPSFLEYQKRMEQGQG